MSTGPKARSALCALLDTLPRFDSLARELRSAVDSCFKSFEEAEMASAHYEKKADVLASRVEGASVKMVEASRAFDVLFAENERARPALEQARRGREAVIEESEKCAEKCLLLERKSQSSQSIIARSSRESIIARPP